MASSVRTGPSSTSSSMNDAANGYSLSFASSSSRQRKQPLHCPAVLRKEVTPPSKKRSSSSNSHSNTSGNSGKSSNSTSCAPYQRHPHSQRLNTAVAPYVRSPLATPSLEPHSQTPFFGGNSTNSSPSNSMMALSPTSPSSAFMPRFKLSPLDTSSPSSTQQQIPQGVLLPRSEWTPDSSVSICQSRDCEVSFGPARHDAASLFGGLTSMIAHPFQSRRHHCRACGKIFCGNHSSNTLYLLNAGNDIQPSSAATSTFPSVERFGIRRGSMPASGTTTPSLSSSSKDQYFPHFEAPTATGSPSSVNGISSGQIVNARVCDDCHVSALVQASLAGITLSGNNNNSMQTPLSPIYRNSSSKNLANRSTPVSLQHSPQNSQILPVAAGARMADSTSSSAASSARTRQESAGTQSATSTADSSVDTSSTTPPSLSSTKVSPVSAEAAVSREISPSALTNQSRTSSSSTYRVDDRTATKPYQQPRLNFPEYRGETTKLRHPLDPGHGRVSALGSAQEGGAGSNPDGSLESGLGTPGVGWTWSTF